MLEKGAPYGTQDSQIWAPYLHAPQIPRPACWDCYEVGGNPKARRHRPGDGRVVYARLRACRPRTRIGHAGAATSPANRRQ